jgi:hypothetical protein
VSHPTTIYHHTAWLKTKMRKIFGIFWEERCPEILDMIYWPHPDSYLQVMSGCKTGAVGVTPGGGGGKGWAERGHVQNWVTNRKKWKGGKGKGGTE